MKFTKDDLLKGKYLLLDRYELAKKAEKGDNISCAFCGNPIVKYRGKIFCNNQRDNSKENCKDRFHNKLKHIDYYLKFYKETEGE